MWHLPAAAGGTRASRGADRFPGLDARDTARLRPLLGTGPPDAAGIAPALAGGGRPAARPGALDHGGGTDAALAPPGTAEPPCRPRLGRPDTHDHVNRASLPVGGPGGGTYGAAACPGSLSLPPPPLSPGLGPIADAALFLDFDGTLVEIAPRPDAVQVQPGLPRLLQRLATGLNGALAIVSGRPLRDLDHFLPVPIAKVGDHGATLRPVPDAPARVARPSARAPRVAGARRLPGGALPRHPDRGQGARLRRALPPRPGRRPGGEDPAGRDARRSPRRRRLHRARSPHGLGGPPARRVQGHGGPQPDGARPLRRPPPGLHRRRRHRRGGHGGGARAWRPGPPAPGLLRRAGGAARLARPLRACAGRRGGGRSARHEAVGDRHQPRPRPEGARRDGRRSGRGAPGRGQPARCHVVRLERQDRRGHRGGALPPAAGPPHLRDARPRRGGLPPVLPGLLQRLPVADPALPPRPRPFRPRGLRRLPRA